MTIKLEVGKRYELNNGQVHECVLDAGLFSLNGYFYSLNGIFAGRADNPDSHWHVKRCVSDGPAAPRLEVGKTYTDNSGVERECIFVDGDRAYLRRAGYRELAAYLWDAETGKALSFCGNNIDIDLTPEPVVQTVRLCMHLASCSPDAPFIATSMTNPTHQLTLTIIGGKVQGTATVEEL